MNHIIAPSLLAADFTKLDKEIELFNESEAQWLHVDVMDGVFVPNISFGMMMLEAVNKLSNKFMDVHLMIVQPEKYIESFREAGADMITVHYEACPHLHRTIQQIKATGSMAGVALNPHTPVSVLEEIIKDIDLVLIMSVNPGFGGQKFIENALNKVQKVKQMIVQSGSSAKIEVDGGVSLQNAKSILDAGADVLVAGNSVYRASNPKAVISDLMKF
ncbi:MAG: ribulose-phosphate 3-epimerase [Saprospiraceae bacterium]|nr:ribulose-phosphate 3-epimerase [Saprospiraceae bacterium]